ncbi:sulfatase-like hydrolase/transferase [Paraglaciecola sp.]|uniref:sulfatase-like hydrolase/transferase n=1 Tax=Paraglaciecola sp. TaxID=1920173 RepID=UPI003EF1266C
MNNKIKYLLIAFPLFSSIGCSQQSSTESIKIIEKPNILFLFTDDQRYDALRAVGNSEISTPNIDKIAKNGLAFTNATIMGSSNGAVCAPSRAMLMTGRHLPQIESPEGDTISNRLTTLPQHLKESGYHTFYTGKWHNGKSSFNRSFSAGKNIFFGGMSDHYKVPLHDYDPTGQYDKETVFYKEQHSSKIYGDSAVEFLDTYINTKPFFLTVAFQAPHDPRQVPDSFLNQYTASQLSLPDNFKPQHTFDNGELDIRDEWLSSTPRKPEVIKRHIQSYYAMVTQIDIEVGRILNALERAGQADNTLILFASDNGIAIGQHGLMGKQNLYEHSIKVPLLVSGPGIKKGKTNMPVYISDLFPTLSELLDLPIPSTVTTESFANRLTSTDESNARKHSIHMYKTYQRAIRTEQFKYITYNIDGVIREQLFDLKNDPLETQDLIKVQPETANELKMLLQSELPKLGDNINFSKPDWGVTHTPSWSEKMLKTSPEAYQKLKKLADADRAKLEG